MTVLTEKEIRQQFAPKDQITTYIKEHPKNFPTYDWKNPKAPINKKLRRRARKIVKASNIKKALGKEASITGAAQPWQIVYGKARVGGCVTFVHTTDNDNKMHIGVTLAGHKIPSSQTIKLFLDDEEVVFGASPDPRWSTDIIRKDGTLASHSGANAANKVFMMWCDGNQTQIPDMMAQCPASGNFSGWTDYHRQEGFAFAYIILVWDPLIFPDGVPELSFELLGKECYDPRTDSTAWTEDAALIIADYLTDTRFGVGRPTTEIDWTSFGNAATLCETLLGDSGPQQYTINGTFDVSENPSSVIDDFQQAMAGCIYKSAGLWKCLPGHWREPTLTLSEADCITLPTVTTKLSLRDGFNGVRGTYTSPEKKWEETDFPPAKNEYYKSLDCNERRWEDIQLPYTIYPVAAQRIAKILVEEAHCQISFECVFGLKAFQLEVGDTFTFSYNRFGWDLKTFRVEEWELVTEDGNGAPVFGVHIIAREFASGVHAWNNGEETVVDYAPDTNLPNVFRVNAITGLALSSGTDELYIRADGTVFNRLKVSWDAVTDAYVSQGGTIQIEYKIHGGAWTPGPIVDGAFTSAYILDVQEYDDYNQVTYDVRIRPINALGVVGPYTEVDLYAVMGKRVPPSDVTGFRADLISFAVMFTWPAIRDLDVLGYELRRGEIGSTWEEADFVAFVSTLNYRLELKTASDNLFFIKAVDTSRNYSLNATSVRVTLEGPAQPSASFYIDGIDIVVQWSEPTSYYAISQYELFFGSPTEADPVPQYANASILAATKGTVFRQRVSWLGTRYFWIAARDVAGNLGPAALVIAQIKGPSAVKNLRGDIIDNNVLLKWGASTDGSLPFSHCLILRGDSFNSAVSVGQVGGTFAAIFESYSGKYTYWVVAVDQVGNKSPAASVTLQVSEPPDFVLRVNGVIDPLKINQGSNVYIEGSGFLYMSGGPGGIGSPIGLLLAITESEIQAGLGGTGSPVGLLLAITES